MTVSIIIAAKTLSKNLEECVGKCLELDFSDLEIIILPDESYGGHLFPGRAPISIIPTGSVSPSAKRDIALRYAKGEILAFIDDDAYPGKDWLKNAVDNFVDTQVAGVGWPAITPHDDALRQKASGLVYSSFLVSAQYAYRYSPKRKKEVDDFPTCNLLVRKSVIQELGGFNTSFWPGEDTKLCLDITNKLGRKIIYEPKALVYHHRRPLFLPHLKQAANYALHRGYFVKRYPQTSLRFSYFVPTLFLFFIVAGTLFSLYITSLKFMYLLGLSLYLLLVFISSISKQLSLIPLVFSGIILTHLTYGFYFLKGLLSKKLAEEK